MPIQDEIGSRMKDYYENIAKTKLLRRTPVAIRIDGKAFHTFTKGFQRPFDRILMTAMQETMKYLCENIQGCVLGYTQSDEITLILIDYQKLNSAAWFDYEIQKLCSVAASMATMKFNQVFSRLVTYHKLDSIEDVFLRGFDLAKDDQKYQDTLHKAVQKGAVFDARCFNIPKEEVANLLYWRQLDATRNSIQMLARAYFSHKELENKSCSQIQDMLMTQKRVNWNDRIDDEKRGSCCIKVRQTNLTDGTERSVWYIDHYIPVFAGEGRNYIESRINPENIEKGADE